MFYCDPCARRRLWPETLTRSYGACEECGNRAACNELPSGMLLAMTGQAAEEERAYRAIMRKMNEKDGT